jgi:topoisomerase IV subunit A
MALMSPASPIHEDIRDTALADALGERYLAYALSTIMSRSLPDVRDGLKPVHRRLLYAMRQLKLDPKSGFKKCARVVGDVMGKYHPHGDMSIYDALVRLAQEFSVRYPLVDGQGNFGNIDGDNAAAMRYTEARMTEIAWIMLDGIDEDAVDFRETYDGEDAEPIVLPASFPNLLANGAAGIAVGMATSIPPHNIIELCDGLLHLIKFPSAHFDKLVDLIPGPDFPTGGVLVEPRETIVESYTKGRGSFRLRARWETEDMGRGQYQIVVTEIPYQIQKARLIEKIAELMELRKLPFLADVRDESAEDIRIVFEPKSRTVEAEMLMEQLFIQTDLETRISLNLNVLDSNTVPRVMSLRDALKEFLDHRHVVLVRRSTYRLDKIEQRLEILEGYLIAFLNLDEVIRIIREEDEPKPVMMKRFKLNEVQTEAILNMRLRQLRKLEEQTIRGEHSDLSAERKDVKALLKDEKRRWKVIAGQISDLKKSFVKDPDLGKRRTEIGKAPKAVVVPLEAFIEREPVTVVCSEKGWVRAIKGHGLDQTKFNFKDGDRARFTMEAQTTDKILLFATNGRFYTIGVDKLPGGRGHGEPIRLLIDLGNAHEIVEIHVHTPDRMLLIASDSGRGFVVTEKDVVAQTRNGKQTLNLSGAEEGRACVPVDEGADAVAVLGDNRKLLIFPLDELPVMTRGRGVILQRYAKGGLRDIKSVTLSEGLTWQTGSGVRSEPDIKAWIGKRAQAGLLVPKGFPKVNRFT